MTITNPIISREFRESPQPFGSGEELTFTVDTTPYGGSPTLLGVTVLDLTDNENNVTVTIVVGSGSVSGNTITLPPMANGTRGRVYKALVRFQSGVNIFEPYLRLVCDR